jgi:hypothetical protein
MRLSELYGKVQAAGDALSYAVSIAAPDSDGVDVDLAAIGRVELHIGPESAEACGLGGIKVPGFTSLLLAAQLCR